MVKKALSWLGYPLVTGGALVFCWWALSHRWPAWAAGVVVVSACTLLVALLERIIPYSAQWATPRGDRATDFWHFVFSNRTFDIGTLAAIGVFAPLGGWLSRRLGIGFWPHEWPLLAQGTLALVVVELPWYWIHRLEHTWAPLWRVHSVHHSSQRIYWWNLARNHPLDNLISAFASMALMSLLGVGEQTLAIVATFSGANAMLQHGNVDLRTGPLDLFFATPRVHRWHHSRRLDESMANYGPTLTLWDYVFGSRSFSPRLHPPLDVGLAPGRESLDYPQDYLGQLRVPFDGRRWKASAAPVAST
jgi:sterol desaturase/sphingolipid hydroxylase (fatty acid hydroxylase superfamily)